MNGETMWLHVRSLGNLAYYPLKCTQSFVNKDSCAILTARLGGTELTTDNKLLRTKICVISFDHVLRFGLLC